MRRQHGSSVKRVYEELKGMAVTYALKPGQRINEIELAKQLGVSRTPLREALTRLDTEGFVRFIQGQGYYLRELNQKQVIDLYELRKAIEIHGLRLSVQRAKDVDLAALQTFLQEAGPDARGRTDQELLKIDETFHERLIEMSENKELARILRNVNERIRFIRWIAMEQTARQRSQEHEAILGALLQRNQEYAVEILEKHISRRLETIVSAIEESILHIYMESPREERLEGGLTPTDLVQG